MYYIVYKTTCLVNNKIYIGKHETENLNDDYLGSGVELLKDIKLFGKDKFVKEILFECKDGKELNQKEKEIVNKDFVARYDTYNLVIGGWSPESHKEIGSIGGKNCWKNTTHDERLNRTLTSRNIICKKLKNKESEWYKKRSNKISNSINKRIQNNGHNWIGKRHTKETKQKIGHINSIRQSGKGNSNYGKCWIHNLESKENKSIDKNDLQDWLNRGWIKGRKMIFN